MQQSDLSFVEKYRFELSCPPSGAQTNQQPAIFLPAPLYSKRIHGQATRVGGTHGPSTSPSQRHTMDPVLEISTTEPAMSYLSSLHGVHHHHHRHRNNTPRYDEKEKQWTRKQKSINIFPPIRAAQTACGRRDTRVHWGGEKEQPGSSEGRKATVLRRSCIPCLGTCRQCRHPVTS